MVDNDKTPAPASFCGFRDGSSLSFERLGHTATWNDVTNEVAKHGANELSFKVPGLLHRSKLRTTETDEGYVLLTASTASQRDLWMNDIRLRISPPHVLQERAKMLIEDAEAGAASIAYLADYMKSLVIDLVRDSM